MTTTILALTDALGTLARFVLLPGHRFGTVGVPPLIHSADFEALIADKAFGSNAILAEREFNRITMRSEKTDQTFSAMIYLDTAVIHSR